MTRRLVGIAMALALAVAACSSAGRDGPASPSTGPAATPSPSALPSPTSVPMPSASPGSGAGADPGSGGGSDGSTGSGIVDPAPPGLGGNPGDPKPAFVTISEGAHDLHPVTATALRAAADGRKVAAQVSWYGGVEPCSVLAGVDVARDGQTITITMTEGSVAAPDTMCVELAMLKATVVDLGELDPGTYTIVAHDAPPVEVVVTG